MDELKEQPYGDSAITDNPSEPPSLGPTSEDLEKHLTSEENDFPSKDFSLPREIIFVAVVCLSQFITQSCFGQILWPVQIIGHGLGATSPGQLSWTVAAYSLTVGTFVLPSGRLGDMYGHKLMVVIGWTWFATCSILAGTSVFVSKGQNAVIMFAVFQGLRGIGPALLLPNSLAILGRTYPAGKRKNMVFAMFAMCAPTGAVLGGTFGALFAQLVWWPWILWSIGITQACVVVAAIVVLPADNANERPKGQKFDFIGATLGVSGMILFNFAWNQAGVVGWPDPYVPTLLGVAIVLLIAFFLYERRVEQPILPPQVFNVGSTITLVVVSLGWASFGVFTYYSVQFIQNIRGYSALSLAAQFSPIAPAVVVAAILTGLLIAKIPGHWLICISATAFTVGVILLATMPAHQIYWAQTFVAFIILPFGMDISFPAASLILSDMVPRHFQGVAASLVNTVINYSISIGLGVAGTAERQVRLDGASELHAYRVALYVGIGMAGGALCVALCFALIMQFQKPKEMVKARADQ